MTTTKFEEEKIFELLISSKELVKVLLNLVVNIVKAQAKKLEKVYESILILDTIGCKYKLGLWVL